jgi:hypothetical protein
MSQEKRIDLVSNLARFMRAKLELHADKGDNWQSCDLSWLLARLRQEVNELGTAVASSTNIAVVWSEAADVANMAAMVADAFEFAAARAAEGSHAD